MFQKLLEEMYYYNCEEGDKIHGGKEYWRLSDVADENYQKLNEALNEEQREWLSDYWEANAGREAEWGSECFQAGLKFGVQFILEIFGDEIFNRHSQEEIPAAKQ